jgi:hypothetical protein
MATQQSMPQLTVPIVTQTEGLDISIEVGDARFVPVTEDDFVVGDANDARDEGIQNKKMFTLDFGNAAEKAHVGDNKFIAAWKIQINVGGRTLNTITLRAQGTPDSGKFLPAPTAVNIWVGDTLDTSVASYTLSYNVYAKTHDSGTSWEEISMAGTVLPDDGGERFSYTPGG